ncbi:hypothetical protein HNQ50_002295 [Silvimonas terrae]|uniref:Pilus assembly protein n=1 Tax=Silvimonas terrae TaxID=300266 RepID=A0A840RE09_9NEIS|nr:hypothetical protein [Silvimonas terrae]MBB5191565.1 hypothetical protein [Silvimonas terrae]
MLRRLKAAGVHLLISLIIFSLIIGLFLHFFYPWPYYEINGLFQGLRITAGVDIILGPLLTALVFAAGKSRRALRFDFSMIALVQIGALAYGIVTLYAQRPYISAFLDRGFQTVRVSDLKLDPALRAHIEQLHGQAAVQPPLLAVRPPKDGEEGAMMFITEMTSSGFPAEFTSRLEPVTAHWAQIVPAALALPAKLPADRQSIVDEFVKAHQIALPDLALFPLKGPFEERMVAFTRKDGQFVGYLNLEPGNYGSAAPRKHG